MSRSDKLLARSFVHVAKRIYTYLFFKPFPKKHIGKWVVK